jgi:hypothetical protein
MSSWAKKNPEKRRAHILKSKYGITIEDYNSMLKQQDNRCAICHSEDPGHHGKFSVDHDHSTNQVRGLLCHHCNVGLGHFFDNASFLLQGAAYLDRFENHD